MISELFTFKKVKRLKAENVRMLFCFAECLIEWPQKKKNYWLEMEFRKKYHPPLQERPEPNS